MDNFVSKLHKRISYLPRNMIVKLYKVRCKWLRMLMHKGMPTDIWVIIEGKVRFEEYLCFCIYLAQAVVMQESEEQSVLEWLATSVLDRPVMVNVDLLGLTSLNREDKIIFIKDGLCKENFRDIRICRETYPSGAMQYEWNRLSLMTNGPIWQFIRKLDGKLFLNS